MATINKRTFLAQACTVNGVAAGGTTVVNLEAGYENVIRTTPDGLQLPIVDRDAQFVRGSMMIMDWVHPVDLLLGSVGTLVFYERKSGAAAATGYVLHTITNPVIYRVALRITKGGMAALTYYFECRFASETATINDVWALTDAQAAPTYVSSTYGGWRVVTCVHGAANIYHVSDQSFEISAPLLKACNDLDLGYTAVDLNVEGGMTATGSLGFEDATVSASQLQVNKLLVAAKANLVTTVKQSGGAANQIITIANVQFNSGAMSGGGNRYSQFSLPYEVTNVAATPLTLGGDNKILTIAAAA
jgi:hypothetical protein